MKRCDYCGKRIWGGWRSNSKYYWHEKCILEDIIMQHLIKGKFLILQGTEKKCSNCGRADWNVHQVGNGCNFCKPYGDK